MITLRVNKLRDAEMRFLLRLIGYRIHGRADTIYTKSFQRALKPKTYKFAKRRKKYYLLDSGMIGTVSDLGDAVPVVECNFGDVAKFATTDFLREGGRD